MLAGFADTPKLLALLIGLFIVSAVLEQALTAIFQWRLFRRYFDGKALKFPIMFLVAIVVVLAFGYDVFEATMKLATGEGDAVLARYKWLSVGLSALVLAGGSAGVYSLLVRLGLRQAPTDVDKTPDIDIAEAWISVTITGAPGIAKLWIEDVAAKTPRSLLDVMTLSGNVTEQSVRTAFGSLVAQNRRFPRYGGYRLKANNLYRLFVETEGPPQSNPFFEGAFASRALIDLCLDTGKLKRADASFIVKEDAK